MENFIISISVSKNSVYLFCNNNATIDCRTIHNQIYESIKNNTINDESNNLKNITKEDLQGYKIYVFLDSILLTGGTESTLPHNECFFGSLNLNENSNFNVLNSSDLNSNNNSNARNLNKNPIVNDLNSSTRTSKDSNNDLDQTKPIYYLEYDESDNAIHILFYTMAQDTPIGFSLINFNKI
ncbi:hypothetical protein [Campylobacter troglodytis]|uniref:hypothetical protein n=1 Tax=Campylobacter troglodytis TaxID=654363 RepID=UPI0011596DA8|nr:hypothetical protein [Campylobacter troglodytis]TQR60567.1 hypothetical protein DMC01_04875 [Campylobacter troglodytis]